MRAGKVSAVVGALVVGGGVVVGTLAGSGSSQVSVDSGGGLPASSPAPEAAVQIHTLPPVGLAPQDPGGGGGGSGQLPAVGPPAVLQPGGGDGGGAPGGSGSGTFYLSGSALLDTNRGAVGSGAVTFGPSVGSGCGAQNRGQWTGVPLRRVQTLSGTPVARLRVSGAANVTVSFVDLDSDNHCLRTVSSGSGPASGGATTIRLAPMNYSYQLGHIVAVVVTATAPVTVTTDGANPSGVTVPSVTGI